jgi:hypothetical protein
MNEDRILMEVDTERNGRNEKITRKQICLDCDRSSLYLLLIQSLGPTALRVHLRAKRAIERVSVVPISEYTLHSLN